MNTRPVVLLAAALALTAATAACGNLGSTSAGGPPPPTGSAAIPPAGSPPAAAPSSSPAPAPSPTGPCTTHACIVAQLEQNLTGLVAQDESVSTKVVCYESTVVYYAAADTYSASCTVTYSDGSQVSGTGNLDFTTDKVTFEPSD
jgi:hypothetical protein